MSATQQTDSEKWLESMQTAILRGLYARALVARKQAEWSKACGDTAYLAGNPAEACVQYRGALLARNDQATLTARIAEQLADGYADAGWVLVGLFEPGPVPNPAPIDGGVHRGVGEGDAGLWLDLDDVPQSAKAPKPLSCQV